MLGALPLMPPGGHMRLITPSKINLHLGVYTTRDARGYHRVDSIMVPLALSNTVDVQFYDQDAPSSVAINFEPALSIDGPKTAAYKAAQTLFELVDKTASFSATVQTLIPAAAGVGSSSADAACVLRALATRWGLDVSDERVIEAARKTGADIAFFLDPKTALFEGAGDTLTRTFPAFDEVDVVLVRPLGSEVSAAAAYRAFDENPTQPQSTHAIAAALEARDVEAVAAALFNNLADASKRLCPAIAKVEAWLQRLPGVLGAMVSGSGSCSFALCESAARAHDIAEAARALGYEAWITRTIKDSTQV